MQRIINQACSDDFAANVTRENVLRSNGGGFSVSGADAFVSVQFGSQGQTSWTEEVHAPIGVGYIEKGTTGIRFRNFVAGQVATISANLSENAEPAVSFGAGGQASTTPNLGVQHNGVLVGTEPILDLIDAGANILTVVDNGGATRIEVTVPRIVTGSVNGATGATVDGSGFNAVRNGTGDYTVNLTTPYGAAPKVLVELTQGKNATQSLAAFPLAGSFHLLTFVPSTGAATDSDFSFFVFPTA